MVESNQGTAGSLEFVKPKKDWNLDLTREEKAAIAKEAQKVGLRKYVEETGCPMRLLRGWVGAYCRKPKDSHPVEKPVRRAYHRKSQVSTLTEAVNKGKPELPSVIDWQQEYIALQARFDGYRHAILDVFGQKSVDIKPLKG